MNAKSQRNVELELKVLNKIDESENLSQRIISRDLNVALGLANSLVKKFVKKGFLKLKEAPFKRYFYYLTPKGMIEKTKLTREYIETSLFFFKKAKEEYEIDLKKQRKTKKIIIVCGISDFTDIAILASKIQDVRIDFIFAKEDYRDSYCGIQIIENLSKIKERKSIHFLIADSKEAKNINFEKCNFTIFQPKSLMG